MTNPIEWAKAYLIANPEISAHHFALVAKVAEAAWDEGYGSGYDDAQFDFDEAFSDGP